MKAPHYLTPTRYDRNALAILDPSRLSGIADGERITGITARGAGPERLRNFHWNARDDASQASGAKPFYRESAGPDGVPCLEFTGTESLRNAAATVPSEYLSGGFTISMVVKIENWTNTQARLSGRALSGADAFASLRPQIGGGQRSLTLYTSTDSFLNNRRLVTDPATDDWMVICAAWQPLAIGPCATLFGDQYVANVLTADTGSAVNVLGTNRNTDINNPAHGDYGLGLVGKYAEFRIDPYAMTETEMRKFRDEQMFRFGLT